MSCGNCGAPVSTPTTRLCGACAGLLAAAQQKARWDAWRAANPERVRERQEKQQAVAERRRKRAEQDAAWDAMLGLEP